MSIKTKEIVFGAALATVVSFIVKKALKGSLDGGGSPRAGKKT
jgi:hypothetical protein